MFTKHNSFRRGTTLVELMIAMLILAIVCVAWLEIIGIQSARKEARRREAVERLAGMMDAFMALTGSGKVTSTSGGEETIKNIKRIKTDSYYCMKVDTDLWKLKIENSTENEITPLFADLESPIGYQLYIVPQSSFPNQKLFYINGSWMWGNGHWLFGKLYDHNGTKSDDDRPFFTLPVYLGLFE